MNTPIKILPRASSTQLLIGIAVGALAFLAGVGIGLDEGLMRTLFAVLVGLVLLVLTLHYQHFAFYLLVIALPLGELLQVDFLSTTLLIIPGGLAFLSLLISWVTRRQTIKLYFPVLIPALLLGIWVSCSALASRIPLAETRPYWLVILLAFLVPNVLRQPEDLRRFSYFLVLSLGLAGVYVLVNRAILLSVHGTTISATQLHNQILDIGDKNKVGLILSLALPAAYYLGDYHRSQPGRRRLLWLAGALALLGLLATVSVGAFIGLCVILVLIIGLQDQHKDRIQAILIGFAILILVFASPLTERLQTVSSISLDDPRFGTNRGTIWRSSILVFSQHWFWGLGSDFDRVGQTVFANIDPLIYATWLDKGKNSILPHNALLSIAVESGLPGLLLYLTLLLSCFWTLWRSLRTLKHFPGERFLYLFGKIIFISLAAWLVQAMGISLHLGKHAWLLIGCIGAYQLIVNQRLAVLTSPSSGT